MSEGFVYIFSNLSLPESLKIGRTSRDPETRAKELFATNIPTPYKVEHSRKFEDSISIEKTVHDTLQEYRINEDREFFNVPLYQAKKVIDDLYIQELEKKIKEYKEKVQICDRCMSGQKSITNKPSQKKRGRRKGSANRKAASGSLSIRKDVKSGAGIYSYWDIETQKIKKLSVPATKVARVDKAIDDGQSVDEIQGIIKETREQLDLF